MKKFINYLKSPKSDVALFILVLILANLVGHRAFLRCDVTAPKSYSLSAASKQVVQTLEEPLSVKVFFTENLPSPYNQVEQYIRDLLVEYKAKANKNFSYEFFNMKDNANERIAANYGLSRVQIQQVKNNEVGFTQAWMGMAFDYQDSKEVLDNLTTSDGLEYKITTTISKMIATTSTLSGLKGEVTLTLYASSALSKFNIAGFKDLEATVRDAYKTVNAKNQNKISFQTIDPASGDVQNLISSYGIQGINWQDPQAGAGTGALGLVLSYGDNFRLVPLRMARTLFGGNAITGMDSLEENLEESLKSLVSKTQEIGYITGHGVKALDDDQEGSKRLQSLISDRYSFKEIDLREDDIPAGLASIVIAGPVGTFEDSELYKIDQFLLRGGNLIIFADAFEQHNPEGQMAYYQQPTFTPISSGLEKILGANGVTLGKNWVLDKNCFVQQSQYAADGKMPIYFAPMLHRSLLDKKNPITRNLGYVIFLQNSAIDISGAQADTGIKTTVLAKSSPQSWLMEKNISVNPTFISEPTGEAAAKMKSENLAVLLEGSFKSAFSENPDAAEAGNDTVLINEHLARSVQSGKIFVTGSSLLTTGQLIDEAGTQPIALFVRNVIDYMNGEEDLCTMRTKGLSLNALKARSAASANIAKYFNQFGLVVLVVLAGFIVWQVRNARRRSIRMEYNPDDTREVSK
ncbi:MAG: Gldg family protein [Treponema sp.]|nr:Gldg family protein [Treponema sp.]